MSEAVKNLFTDISTSYDRLNHLLSLNIDKVWRKKAIQLIERNKNDNFHALDLCCGTYDLSLECFKQFPQCNITASDFSQGMLDAGLPKIKKFRESKQINVVQADALNLPFDDERFDVIFCAYGVRNLDDTKKGLLEIQRVLKPGGQIIVLEFFKPDRPMAHLFHKTYANIIIPTLGKMVSGHSSAYHYLRDSIQGFMTIEEFKALGLQCDYQNIFAKDFLFSISTAISLKKEG